MQLMDIKEIFPESTIFMDEPLSRYTFTETGGPADALIFPKTIKEIQAIVSWLNENEIPLTVLGNASNLIVKDGGIRGAVVMVTEMKDIVINGEEIISDAGARLIDTSQTAGDNGLTGLEFAIGIPGSVGGAVYMNAGAYGGEVTDVITSVKVLTRDGELKIYSNKEMDFSYRHSIVQETGDIVLQTKFQLEKGNPEFIRDRMDELTELRWSKQPLEYPSCGSVFKRPPGHYTGKLIQDVGLQGLIHGGAQISEKHAGFIVNIDNASATDYVELIEHIQDVILNEYGVTLETEVKIIGNDPE